MNIGGGSISDHDAARRCGLNVNVVQANASAADNLQFRGSCEHLGVHGGGGTNQECIGVLDSFQQFRAVRAVNPAHLDGVAESIDGGLSEFIGDEDDGTGILAHRIS